MSQEYILCNKSAVYFLKVQSMSQRIQFMFPVYSLSPKITVYVYLQRMFLSQKYSLCPKSTVYLPRLQFISPDNVFVPIVQFMSQEYSLCPFSTVYVPRVQSM